MRAVASIEFQAASTEEAEAIVATWTAPGAESVSVTVYGEETNTVLVVEASENSPASMVGGRASFAQS
jgi:hypothetical protein